MSIIRIYIPYFRQPIRLLLSIKIILLILILFIILYNTKFFNKQNQWCDPEKHLWWFCPWPDPQTTVCTWDQHFPTINNQIQ
jgi:hypothetical protein